ncbi:hypothetical protein [Allokutzneria albata]|uniref:Uncharacterized protein n=1 Tax=Allokutzneria albata TaxID=211114 RepID=A0A1H0CL24_ALLAB|nr:hypothetical protein [Allokutzneria albata]SDN58579.1 hypothetical protein SAMN04489726_7291 [Allokutzneria albata]
MTHASGLENLHSRISPAVLSAALSKYGWQLVGGKEGLYSRWAYGENRSTRILIPLDETKPDFDELLTDAVSSLAALRTEPAQRVLRVISGVPGDELKFRKDSETPPGTIRWDLGQELIQAANDTLVASAKAASDRRPSFRNSNWFIARDFLQSVLMGQTEVGSYVVTAYTPPEQHFFERESQKNSARHSLDGAHTGREVVEVMTGALQVTREAIDIYQRTKRIEEFDDTVQHGVSRELAVAVQKLVKQSDGASVSVEWSTRFDDDFLLSSETARTGVTEVDFNPPDYAVLERAAIRLGAASESSTVTVVGTVEVLTRRVGTVGVVALNIMRGSSAKKLRVRLPTDAYEVALEAHRRMDAIKVTGRQERSGNYYWLYDATDVTIVELYKDKNPEQGKLFE